MIRFTIALSSVLIWSLLASPVAIGQEPAKTTAPAGEPVGQANPPVHAQAKEGLVNLNLILDEEVDDPTLQAQLKTDPNFQKYLPYRLGLQTQAQAKLQDALETNFGLSLSDADDTLRAQLEIPYGEGVVVVGVKAGSLAEHAGLKVNDLLLSLGDRKAESWGQVKEILLGLGKEALEVKLIREGKPSRMSLVGPKHGFPPEAAEYWIGTPVSPVDATLRAHLPSIPSEAGLVVNDVVKGSPADQVSVHKDDILIALDGKPLTNADALIAAIQASQGKPAPLQLVRAGKPLTLTITPAKRAHPTVINLKTNPEAFNFVYQFAQPSMAIEVEPGLQGAPGVKKPVRLKQFEERPPLSGNVALVPHAGMPDQTGNFFAWTLQKRASVESSTARIEGQLKEVMAKLEEISKNLEAIKKSAGR
jgi:membrane-associated protease RseP (regulator of RpoE activity)